jgi:hypothetical protein
MAVWVTGSRQAIMDSKRFQVRPRSTFAGRIGVARVDITPPVGIYTREWGAASHSVADSIHRPLYLTALAIQSDAAGSPLVFVDADLGFWRNKLRFQELRAAIQIKLSLEPERFLFGLSHTHSSVTLADPDSALPGGELLEPYLKRLQQAAEQAIQGAIQNAQEARLEWQYGRCALASNRDLPEPTPGSSRVICGFNPNARADDTLLVGRVTSQTGTVLAIITNYACHPTTLAWENTAISPDFVGVKNLSETRPNCHPE